MNNKLYENIKPDWFNFFVENELFIKIDQIINTFDKLKKVYPQELDILRIFKLIDINDISVIILGQDPYHSKDFADGIAFLSKRNDEIPLSLRNIFKKLDNELNIKHFNNNFLFGWVEQGVFFDKFFTSGLRK